MKDLSPSDLKTILHSKRADKYIAHIRYDGVVQSVELHLKEAGELASYFAAKIGLADAGLILGLLHDLGKLSKQFQNYIGSAVGNFDIDDEEWVDAKSLKGKIDHSTAGAQYLWQKLSVIATKVGQGELCAQILSMCIASHHSGLIDCLNEDGENNFLRRMNKSYEKTNLPEAILNLSPELKEQIDHLLSVNLVKRVFNKVRGFTKQPKQKETFNHEESFTLGVLTRFLFSCLIDADRLNSAEFEDPQKKLIRQKLSGLVDWPLAIKRLDAKLSTFKIENAIDEIRRDISDTCFKRASSMQGIYTLTVPTGGGKTLASMRFALEHARQNKLDRIFFIIPYTSIIEQNANAIKDILEREQDAFSWVLEHHSNLEPEQQTWHSKLASVNWDTPIIFTTMVQFLDTLFSGGTRSVRRMHQLAKSVLIFDEVQTLPISCVHMFSHSLNFLCEQANTTAVLCTATQPLLNNLPTSSYGQLRLVDDSEIVEDKSKLFEDLKRVVVNNSCKSGGWSEREIFDLVLKRNYENQSCLVIVNTKSWARKIFIECQQTIHKDALFHLSTNQCAAHRKIILKKIRDRLTQHLPVLCISTQLIEAGVDVDFANVIRFLAGLDSIAQAGGRCNRNGRLKNKLGEFTCGQVDVINPTDESITSLVDIVEGQEAAKRVFGEMNLTDILSPAAMDTYFQYYFFERHKDMIYPLPKQNDCLLNILANNDKNNGAGANKERAKLGKTPILQQSFMAAGKAFKAIDAPTQSVIVPYGDQGEAIINQLCCTSKKFDAGGFYDALRKAQQYSVNVFPNVWQKLLEQTAVIEVQEGEGIYYLDKQFYSEYFGLSDEKRECFASLIC